MILDSRLICWATMYINLAVVPILFMCSASTAAHHGI